MTKREQRKTIMERVDRLAIEVAKDIGDIRWELYDIREDIESLIGHLNRPSLWQRIIRRIFR